MIYKVDEDVYTGFYGEVYHIYSLYKKPFKFYPFWTFVFSAYNKEGIQEKLKSIKLNPLYEGTLKQILENFSH